ncbi:MAG: BatD family protein [Bacteroidales bacterium]|nr:BatD family protein [Bacteroidales bacterium]
MKKIVFLILLISCLYCFADDIKFTASAPGSVKTGQQFQLTYSLNAKPKKFFPPNIVDFDVLAGPSQSSSSSVQIVNGQMTQSYSFTYTYILQANKEGKFTIPPASIAIDKETYQSNEVIIEVANMPSQPKAQSSQQGQSQGAAVNVADNSEIFAEVSLNKKNVYQGEAIIASVKFYSKYDIANYADPVIPKFDGFIVEDIDIGNVSFKTEVINGQTFRTVLFKKAVLIPQITGEITIEPFEWEVIYNVRVNRKSYSVFDDFFGSYQSVKKVVKSQPVKIYVKPLPDGKPGDFSGAVGTFNFNASLNNNKVKENDAITLKVTINGNGNLKFIDPPKIQFPHDFEVYDPKVNVNAKASTNGLTGSKTFEYLMIPRHAGEYSIPTFSFNYFDINSRQYKAINSPKFNISVERGTGNQEQVIVSGLSKEDVKFFGKDIRYIKTNKIKPYPINVFLFGSKQFFLLYAVSLIVFIIIVFAWKNRIKQNANIQRVKNKKANKLARKRLKTALQYLKENNKDKFYEEIVKAIWGYLSDKLTIPLSALSKDTAIESLSKHNLQDEIKNKLINLIDNCEFARFAPPVEGYQMDESYKKAITIISKLENLIK